MYIGNNLQVAYPTYKNIDDISGSFNGVTTSFALTVGGVAPVPAPLSSNQCMISVGGVVQRPDDTGTEGFRLSGGNIVFSSAPNTGEDFFGVILAGADYVNVGVNFPSGSASTPSITFDTDLDTGLYNLASNELGITTAGTSRLIVDSSGNVNIDSNTLYVDAVNNRVGVGTASPGATLDVAPDANRNLQVQGKGGTTYGLEIKNGTANSGGEFHVTAASNGGVVFNRGTTEMGRFDSNSRLLVGTSSATSNFVIQCVNGNNASGDGAYYSRLGNNCNNTSSYHLRSETQGVLNWYLYGNGTTSFTSDERKKKNIETTRDGYLEDLLKLRVVKYNWINQEDTDAKELGLIAQEVEQVFPGLVQDGDVLGNDTFPTKVLKGSVLPFMILKALQEAVAKIESLEARLTAAGL